MAWAPRTISNLHTTLASRFDPDLAFSGIVSLQIPQGLTNVNNQRIS